MVKIKHVRTIDVVIVGWRPGKEEGTVGSLILGLYDEKGKLRPDRPHLRAEGEGEEGARQEAGAVRDRRRRQRRPEPLGHRPRPGVALAASRAGRRDHLRPHQRRPHPPRLQDHALARRQEAEGVHARPARLAAGLVDRRGVLEQDRPDVDLPDRRREQHRDRDRHRDHRRGQQLVPLVAPRGDRPGGERQEDGGQLQQGVGAAVTRTSSAGEISQAVGEGRADDPEQQRLRDQREARDQDDPGERDGPSALVDPARDPPLALGREGQRDCRR